MEKIKCITDIHLNYKENLSYNYKEKGEILIICGDIGDPVETYYFEFLSKISKNFNIIFLVPGNHEFRYSNYQDSLIQLKKLCNYFNHIILLHQSSYLYYPKNNDSEILFIGTTLWCDVPKEPKIEEYYLNNINDFKKIKFNSDYITPKNIRMLHNIETNFINSQVNNSNCKKCIIITHFPPITYSNNNSLNKSLDKHSKPGLEDYYNNNILNKINFKKDCEYIWYFGHSHEKYYSKEDNLILVNSY